MKQIFIIAVAALMSACCNQNEKEMGPLFRKMCSPKAL